MKESGQFRRGVDLFNEGKFFEAHEVWEELWLAEAEPEKTFLQGLIQVAAAFHHHERGNLRGTRSLLAAGLAKLGQFPDEHRGIALAELREGTSDWVGAVSDVQGARVRRLPRIRAVGRTAAKRKRSR
jgi:uncharacterized protein